MNEIPEFPDQTAPTSTDQASQTLQPPSVRQRPALQKSATVEESLPSPEVEVITVDER
jgi:hypothetical protein